MSRRFALYDLDKTVLRHASFTPFLIFAARRRSRLRLLLLPVWILAMAGYKLGLWSRAALKQFGLRLMIGKGLSEERLAVLGKAYADHILPRWLAPGAARSIERDRAEDRELWLVTAAMGFYAEEIGRRLGFHRVIATGHEFENDGHIGLCGDNCYGSSKVARMVEALAVDEIDRDAAEFVFYSDSVSDAPLFDWCERAVLVNGSAKGRRLAARRGWDSAEF